MGGLLSKSEVMARIRQMDPYEFEELVGGIWKSRGYSVNVRKGSGDRGIDVEAYKHKGQPSQIKELIQVKRYSSNNKVGSKQIREYATIYQQEDHVDGVVLVTSGEFTDQARELANDLQVDTINGTELFHLLDSECPELVVKSFKNSSSKQIKNQDTVEQFSVAESPFDQEKNWRHVNPNQTHFDSCPECGSGTVWFGKLNGIRHLKCASCFSEWKKEEIKIEEGWWIFTVTNSRPGWREIVGPNENKFQSKREWNP